MSGWLIETLLASAALIALVLVLRDAVSDLFGPRVAYALWLLPVLRMLLPPMPAEWLPRLPAILPSAATDTTLPLAVLIADNGASAALPATSVAPMAPTLFDSIPVTLPLPLVALWLVALLWFVMQMLRYRRFLAHALDGAVRLPSDGAIEILVSPAVRGPVAVGIVRRRILLPPDFLTRYAPEERRLALWHEAAHHARRDIIANLAALAVRALHWWNPLAPAAYRRSDAEDRAAYGRALLKSAVPTMPALVAALDPRIELTRRISMMTQAPYGRLRLFAGAALAATMIGGGVMATASTVAPQQIAVADAPAVPVVPAPPVPAMPSSMQPGPAIHAVPVPPSAPATPEPPLALAAVDAPPPPAPMPPAGHTIIIHKGKLSAEEREAIREARQAAAESRREAAEARAEALQEAAEARREHAEARREAARAHAEAMRAAVAARGPEFKAAMQARHLEMQHAFAERDRALREIPRQVEASLAHARSRMIAQCAAKGVKMPADSDFGTLATCGEHLGRTIRVALTSARAAIAASTELSAEQRANALKGLDSALSEIGREPFR